MLLLPAEGEAAKFSSSVALVNGSVGGLIRQRLSGWAVLGSEIDSTAGGVCSGRKLSPSRSSTWLPVSRSEWESIASSGAGGGADARPSVGIGR